MEALPVQPGSRRLRLALFTRRPGRRRRRAPLPWQRRGQHHPVNPDVRVPADTKREDELHASAKEKDAEEPGGIASGGPKKADDDRRTGNPKIPEEAADPEKKERTGDTLRDRHVPGGGWLTKCV
ncbi:hypothetical protein NDU88_006554 [Pleurodeles waltl]|uniref:Uncharacterized protein n=1 Tax=Pleurodeles waltl TaxID=8319 RepID=A0AAV7X100_PLEWA|nr:hypothetical protein NDU88_006554 [Pleurodeles waltl]